MNLRLGLFTIFLFKLAIGQDFQYQNFNELNGLPSSETYEVFQDSIGFIWIATDRGISRYDGGEFRNFGIRDGLSDNTVFGFYEDRQNRIWFRTYSGALSYFQNDSIYRYAHNEALMDKLGRSILTKIFTDSLDNLWCSTIMPGKAGRIDKGGNISMIEDGTDEYLFLHHISEQNYLLGYTPRSSKVRTIKINDVQYSVEISSMNSGSPHFSYASWNDQLFISMNRDIFRFHNDQLEKVFTSELTIINLTVDSENSLWVGFFDGGVKKFANGQFNSFEEIPLLKRESVGNVLKDREGGLWFSTLDRGIFYIPNIEINLLLWRENAKVSCADASENRLYVGNYQGELTALDAPSKSVIWSKNFKFPINSLFVDSRENIWVCDIKQLQCFSPAGDKIFGLPMIQGAKCYQESKDGLVWVGNNTGLFKVSPTGKVVTHGILQKRISSLFVTDSMTYVGSLNGLNTYSNDLLQKENSYNIKSRISVLHEFSPGVLLIGTIGQGLIVLTEDGLEYPGKDNELGDIVYAITQVKDNLWISTEKGIARVRMRALMKAGFEFDFLTRTSGLISDKNNILVPTKSDIWSFSDLGISIFPQDIQTFQNRQPVIYLKSVQVNDVAVRPDIFAFSPDRNNVAIDIGVISFNNRKLFYRHRLNHSATWNQTQNRAVSYYSLRPNHYQFEMQASSDNSSWAAIPIALDFEILTPWWRSWYAIVCYVFAFGAIGLGFYKMRTNDWKRRQAYLEVINNHQQKLIQSELEALERDRRRIAKDLHDGVGTALTSVKWIVQDTIQHKPTDQDKSLKTINDNFNDIILEIKRIIYDLNPPALERYGLEVGLKNFIDRLSERTGILARFDYFGRGAIDPKISITIYRIIQELINNTVKHSKATEIKIHVNQFEDFMNVMYEDNGIGMRAGHAKGLGMHNIESRVQALKGNMTLETSGMGTFYNFDIPFKTVT